MISFKTLCVYILGSSSRSGAFGDSRKTNFQLALKISVLVGEKNLLILIYSKCYVHSFYRQKTQQIIIFNFISQMFN